MPLCLRSLKAVLYVFLSAAVVLCFSPASATAGEPAPTDFADFDGDGINDNAADEDGDGIPDAADPDYLKPPPQSESTGLVDFSSALSGSDFDEKLLTNSEKFGQRKFGARALSTSRCGFTSDDCCGSGKVLDIGVTAGGGACSGGICH